MVVRRRSIVRERLQAGLAAPYFEDFNIWLRSRNYTEKTIAERLRLLASWTHWASSKRYAFDTIRAAHAASAIAAQEERRPRFRGDLRKDTIEVAALFIRYLEDKGALPRLPAKPMAPILAEFTAWAREQHGLAETTLGTYLRILIRFVENLGDDPDRYDAASLRAHLLDRAKGVSVGRTKGIRVAIRAFLRFLIATGRCPPGRDNALPSIAEWRLALTPRFLPETDIAQILAACEGERRLRDRAIILLLVRLGLRASEVAGLTFDDIDWRHGNIRLHGKGRREELLPLTQEVGDALLAYIKERPALPLPAVFLTEFAPLRPIGRIAVKCLVARALKRGGVESRHKGAHVLRHSAATAMLRHGVSLAGVSTVLRHRSPTMTTHYAKVDIALLATVAQPWPGRLP